MSVYFAGARCVPAWARPFEKTEVAFVWHLIRLGRIASNFSPAFVQVDELANFRLFGLL